MNEYTIYPNPHTPISPSRRHRPLQGYYHWWGSSPEKMSTPVVTDRWAGTLECTTCGRKRLMAQEFSKKAMEKYRKANNTGPLKCKQCVTQMEEKEREAAASKKAAGGSTPDEKRECIACKQNLPFDSYNKNQWNKGPGKSKCRLCVDKMVAVETKNQQQAKEVKLEAARTKVAQAKAAGNQMEILKAESQLSALEAELVTGLKPVKMGRGRGGGRSRGGRGGRGSMRK